MGPDTPPEFVTPRVVHRATVHLAEPDPAWPRAYDGVAARIRAALGDRAVLLEHVGSTSIPGLVAKPVIDVVLEVPDSTDEAAYVGDLESAGFPLAVREPAWHEHRLFRAVDPTVNLHVFSSGCDETRRMLRFRDRLRTHPEDRDRYAAVKRELAAREWEYVQDYADAKSAVVEEILASSVERPRSRVADEFVQLNFLDRP